MFEFVNFCAEVLTQLVDMLFSIDIGGYSYGDFLVAFLLVSVLVSSLVVRFGRSGGSVSAPPRIRGGASSGSSELE